MTTFKTKAKITEKGSVTLSGIPFDIGDEVEIIVQNLGRRPASDKTYPLRGKPFKYIRPYDSVAEEDWKDYT